MRMLRMFFLIALALPALAHGAEYSGSSITIEDVALLASPPILPSQPPPYEGDSCMVKISLRMPGEPRMEGYMKILPCDLEGLARLGKLRGITFR